MYLLFVLLLFVCNQSFTTIHQYQKKHLLLGFPRALTPRGLENATPRFEDRPGMSQIQQHSTALLVDMIRLRVMIWWVMMGYVSYEPTNLPFVYWRYIGDDCISESIHEETFFCEPYKWRMKQWWAGLEKMSQLHWTHIYLDLQAPWRAERSIMHQFFLFYFLPFASICIHLPGFLTFSWLFLQGLLLIFAPRLMDFTTARAGLILILSCHQVCPTFGSIQLHSRRLWWKMRGWRSSKLCWDESWWVVVQSKDLPLLAVFFLCPGENLRICRVFKLPLLSGCQSFDGNVDALGLASMGTAPWMQVRSTMELVCFNALKRPTSTTHIREFFGSFW